MTPAPPAVVVAAPPPEPAPPVEGPAPAPLSLPEGSADELPPAPLDDFVRGLEAVGDRLITAEVRLDAGGGGVPLLLTVEEKGLPVATLSPGTRFASCGRVDVAIERVQGPPSSLVLAQHFCEEGEDELSREIQAFVIHVGDAVSPPRVLWSGSGTFRSSFGVCDQIDVPVAWVEPPGRLLVDRWTEVVARPNPRHLGGTEPCPARRSHRRRLFEASF